MAHQLNLRLVLGVGAVAVLVIPGVMLQHARQEARLIRELRTQARDAEAEGRADRAALLLERYLTLNPGDMEALADYALLLDRVPDTNRQRSRQVSALETVVNHNPAQGPARRRLAELLLETGDPDRALEHLDRLSSAKPRDADLLTLTGRCQEAKGALDKAERAYELALQADPARPAAYVLLAGLAERQGKPQQAQHVLDDLVEHNPGNPEVYILRCRFRLGQGQLAGAEEDLKRYRSRKGPPQAPEYLQAQADLAGRRGDGAGARRAYELALGFRPGNVALSLGLVQLELDEGHAAEALEWVNRALAAHPNHPDLVPLRVDALLAQGRFAEAREAIASLRGEDAPPGLANSLEGRWCMARGAWAEAITLLEDVLRVERKPAGLDQRVYLDLGVCRERLGRLDAAAAAYQQAADLDPTGVPRGRSLSTLARLGRARVALCQTLTGNGSGDREAEEVIRWAARQPGSATGAALLLADLRLSRGRADSASAFDEVRKANGFAELADLWLAEARWCAALGNASSARLVLVRAEAQLGDRVEWRLTRLELAAQLPYDEAVALVRAELPEPGAPAGFVGRALAREAARRPPAVWPMLQATSDQLLPRPVLEGLAVRDQIRLLRQVALVQTRLGETGEAARLRRLLASRPLPDPASAVFLLDVALEDGDEAAAAAAADYFDGAGVAGAAYAKVARAVPWVRRYRGGEEAAQAEARKLLAGVPADAGAAARADWLRAVLDDLAGRTEEALTGYLNAARRGELRLPLLTRVVALLRERQRFVEADQFFEQAERSVLLRDGLARLAADTALRAGRPERAARLARRGVSAGMGPDAAVWLGQFLDRAGQPQAAEQVLRDAVTRTPTLNTGVALVAHLAAVGRLPEAATERARLAERIPEPDRTLALALCDEALGHWAEAAREYEKAASATPGSAAVRVAAARFYLRGARAEAALPHLMALFPPPPYEATDNGRLVRALSRLAAGPPATPPDELVPWARRQLALTLADVDPVANRDKALALLPVEEDGVSLAERTANARVRAFLRAADPAQRPAVLSALEAQIAELDGSERFRLAGLAEALGDATRARSLARSALDADPGNPEYLATLIRMQIRANEQAEAKHLLGLLVEREGESERCRELKSLVISH